MMSRPGDPSLAVRYARLAAEAGDARAAIVALERVLRIDPSLDNIRLELASLHLAAGSPDLAAAYARQALQNPSIPPEVAARARMLLANAERGAARQTFDVNLFAGLRYDTNANEATTLGSAPIFVPVLQDFFDVPVAVRGRSDWSMVLGARAQHRADLGLQREGSWETNAAVFDQRFARIARDYDLTIAAVDTGPRIAVAEWGDQIRLALRPLASLTWVGYGGRTYGWLYGGGLGAELRMDQRWTVEASWLGRFGNYQDSAFRPRARDYTGFENVVTLGLGYAPDPVTRLGAAITYVHADARQEFYQRQSLGAGLSASTLFQLGPVPLGATARVGVRRVRFDAPDPLINPEQSRRDTRWEAGLSLALPIAGPLALVAEYDWFDQRSNYGFYRYDNHAVTLGLRASF